MTPSSQQYPLAHPSFTTTQPSSILDGPPGGTITPSPVEGIDGSFTPTPPGISGANEKDGGRLGSAGSGSGVGPTPGSGGWGLLSSQQPLMQQPGSW